jgi:hypothetical protein
MEIRGGGAGFRIATAMLALCACGDPPTFDPGAASISVTNLTYGDPIEGDGYTVSVDGGSEQVMGVNASVLLSELTPGPHLLELSGIATHCAVNGVNPRTVQTAASLTAQSKFLVDCRVPGTGRIIVETYTYGTGPEHYRIDLDIGRGGPIGANDELTFPAVPTGTITLTLTTGTESCVVSSPNPRTLQLEEGAQVPSRFKIHCPE